MKYLWIFIYVLSFQVYANNDFTIECRGRENLLVNYEAGKLIVKGTKTGLDIQNAFGTHTVKFFIEVDKTYCDQHHRNLFVKRCSYSKTSSSKLEVRDISGNVLQSTEETLGAYFHLESAFQTLETIDGMNSTLGATRGYNFVLSTWKAWRFQFNYNETLCHAY